MTPARVIQVTTADRAIVAHLAAAALLTAAACERPTRPIPPPDRLAWYVRDHTGAGIPTSDAQTAYFSTIDHVIVAVDKATGDTRWTARPNTFADNAPPIALVRAGGCLLVNDYDAWCLDPATGSVRWRFPSPPDDRAGYRIPAAADGVVFTGSTSGHVTALDLSTGELRWQTHLAAATNVYSPIVRDGVVYVSYNLLPPPPEMIRGGLAALDASTGEVRWTRALPVTLSHTGSVTREAAISGGIIAATTTDGYVYAYHLADGRVAWRGERAVPVTGGEPAEQDHRVLGANDTYVFVGSTAQGSVTAFDADDGRVAWTARVDMDSPMVVQVFGATVWVTTISGRVLAFAVTTGTPTDLFDRPRLPAGEEGFSGVAVDDALIYLGGNRALYAFRR